MSNMAATGTQSIRCTTHTHDKVTKAKVTLENFYTNLWFQKEERKNRWVYHLTILTFIVVLCAGLLTQCTVCSGGTKFFMCGGIEGENAFMRAQNPIDLLKMANFCHFILLTGGKWRKSFWLGKNVPMVPPPLGAAPDCVAVQLI